MLGKKEYRFADIARIYFKTVPLQTFSTIVCTILISLLPAFQALAIASFIDTALSIFNNGSSYNSIYMPLVLIAVCVLVSQLLPLLMGLVSLNKKNKLSVTLERETVAKSSRLHYRHLEDKDDCELIYRVMQNSVDSFEMGLNCIFSILGFAIGMISILSIITTSSPIAGGIVFIACIPLCFLAIRNGKKNYEMGVETKEIQRKYQYLTEVLTDRIFAEERRLFSFGNSLSARYEKLYDESFNIEKRIKVKTFILLKSGSIASLFISIGIILILLYSLLNGEMTIGIFIALINAIFSLVQSMSWQLSETMQNFSWVKSFLSDFSRFFGLGEKHEASSTPAYVSQASFEMLEFRNVSFKYPGTNLYILKNCSFLMDKNQSYAFVGENGAGKTTIVKLIAGLYDEYEGEILLNGKELREYSFGQIKKLVSIVFQDFSKYSLSIKDNILLGDITACDEKQASSIISQLGLKDMISHLELGWDTNLGKIHENSIDISGGEWQRLAIARLLYSNAIINILDEPTAALDPIEESKVYDMFKKLSKDRFTICITHRLGAAKSSDTIFLLSEGCIAEEGTHKSLMTIRDGQYKKMFNTQKSWYINANVLSSVRGEL